MWVRTGNQTFQLEEIPHSKLDACTPFEQEILGFIQEWLKGQTEFEVKTSGSTGPPKTIRFDRSQLIHSAKQSEVALGLKPGFNAMLCLDIKHIAGKMVIIRSLVTRMNLIAIEPCANPFVYLPDNLRVDYVSFVPLQVETIINSSHRHQLSEMQTVLIGGAPMHPKLKRQVANLQGRWFASYGMTETISHIALQRLNGPEKAEWFKVLPGIHIELDERGCLVINAEYLGPDKIVTNDIVELKSPTEFIWRGRFDHVINSGGFKVHPEEVESKLAQKFSREGLNRRYFIGPHTNEKLGQEVALIVEGMPLHGKASDDLHFWMRENLNRYEVPARIFYIDHFVNTENGKLRRRATLNLLSAQPVGRDGSSTNR